MSEVTQPSREAQIQYEVKRRARLGVLAAAAGVLYELSTQILAAVLRNVPTVGVLQGLGPAFRGVAYPVISPGAAEVRYIHSKAFGTIAGSLIAAVALGFIVVSLTFVSDATRFRRPQSMRSTRWLIIIGGLGFAVLSVVHEVINAIETAQFVHGHDYSNAAVQHALTSNTPALVTSYLGPIVAIAFAVGVGAASLNAMRAGLFPRPLAYVGLLCAFLFVVPLSTLELLISLWLVGVGFLLLGRWPGGDPPAWESGEARPWPTAAEKRIAAGGAAVEPRRGLFGGRGSGNGSAPAAVVDAPPEPTARPHPRSNKRKRRRDR